jgi:hypothetical protein
MTDLQRAARLLVAAISPQIVAAIIKALGEDRG